MGTWGVDFWDQREVIEKHTQSGIEFLDKCASFMKERIRIEQEYAKSLRRLVKQYQFKKKEEDILFSYQSSYKQFLEENDDFAGQREVISEELYNNILKPMQKLSLESKTERKKTLQKLTECKIQLDQHHKTLIVAKKKYDQAREDANTALKSYDAAAQSLDMTKAQILKFQKTSQDKGMQAEKALEEYKTMLDSFNSRQTLYYEMELPGIINSELQLPEENRIEQLSNFFQGYAKIQQDVTPIISKCFEGMTEAAKLCKPADDSLLLIDKYKSGEFHPGDVEFEEYGKPNGSTLVFTVPKGKLNKPSLWAKKKEVLLNENIANDYADLPPAQRKKKFNKAITSLQEQLHQLDKAKSGLLKMRETSEKFGGDPDNIQNQIDVNEKETERIKPLLHQYQCYLAATIDADVARKNSRSTSNVNSPPTTMFEAVVISDVTYKEESLQQESMQPTTPIPDFAADEFDDELRCTVLYDFSGSNDGEMTVYAGEELVIADEDDSGWTRVMRGYDEGYIPTSYIEKI